MPDLTGLNDYIRWDAASMKELIVNKLQENEVFTDQIFEDSNLSVIIDVFSYMYDVLTYQLNHGGTEAIFTDAQLYENINRVVKMLSYNPAGFITSTVTNTMGVRTSLNSSGIYTIPKFTTVETSLSDSNGIPIKYAFTENYTFVANSTTAIDSDFTPILYNGAWKLYDSTFVATGIPSETFTLANIELDGDDKIYVSNVDVYVYVKHTDGSYTEFSPTINLFNSLPTDKHFEVRINENKQYTLRFGDNVYGDQLSENDTLYVVYLESNGKDGEIGAGKISTDLQLTVAIDGLNETFIKNNVLKVDDHPEFIKFGSDPDEQLSQITLVNADASSGIKDLETVEEIRTNAPNNFRMGSRLITEQDFRQYTLTNYVSNVYDVEVMNGWEYMVEFQQWLKAYDKLSIDIRFYDYEYLDSCDFNNVYLWVKSYGNSNIAKSLKRVMERDMNRLKPATSELSFLDPLLVTCTPWLGGTYGITDWDANHENKIQIVRDRNTLITVERIKQNAVKTCQDFFAVENQSLGNSININDLYNSLVAIDGVKEVRTSYLPTGSPASETQYFDGLSFGIWTQHIILGDDLTKISGNFKIKKFQFPFLLDSNTFSNKIEVLSDSYNVSEIEY